MSRSEEDNERERPPNLQGALLIDSVKRKQCRDESRQTGGGGTLTGHCPE